MGMGALILSVALASPHAIQPWERHVELGLHAGVSFSRLQAPGEGRPKMHQHAAALVGGSLSLELTPRLGAEIAPTYTTRGFEGRLLVGSDEPEFYNGPGMDVQEIRELVIPIRVRYVVRRAGFRPYIIAALEPSVILSAQAWIDGRRAANEYDLFLQREAQFGIAGGAGIQAPLGGALSFLEATYTHGLTQVNDRRMFPRTEFENRSFALALGVRWRPGGSTPSSSTLSR